MIRTSIFDDQDELFLLLTNRLGEFAIWPVSVEIPDGWVTASEPASKAECSSQASATRPLRDLMSN